MKYLYTFFVFILSLNCSSAQSVLQFASLGDFQLGSGQSIKDCKIGYRTYGTLNAEKSNAILIPTWFTGTSEQSKNAVRNMIDSTRFYIILVDALGNGVSSSPSNSEKQKGKNFPKFTIQDMVNSQYKMLTENLKINHLYAIMGISMGGMQTLQWATSYPNFTDNAVSIVGTPKQSFNDLLLWQAELQPIEDAKNKKEEIKAMQIVGLVHALNISSPSNRNAQKVDFYSFAEKTKSDMTKVSAQNWAAQIRAMKKLKAKVLIVYSLQDMMVNPQESMELADLLQSERFELKGNCGHLAVSCEGVELAKTVRAFLNK